MKATTALINAAIAKHDVEIVKATGQGYFYLVGPGMLGAYSESIFIPRLNCQPLEAWIRDCEDLIEAARKNRE